MSATAMQKTNIKDQYFQTYSYFMAAINKPLGGAGNILSNYLAYISREIGNAIQTLKKLEKEIDDWPLAKVDEFVEDEDIVNFYDQAQQLKKQIQGLSKEKPQYKEIERKFKEYIEQFISVYEKASAIMKDEESKQDQNMSLRSFWKDWDTDADKHWESM